MKKYAFLILAHADPIHLRKLVYSLDFEHFDIYIHIDKKQDITSFQFGKYTLKHSDLFIIEDRVSVHWGDISVVHATLKMYMTAFKNKKYERFITISGLDYPIKNNREIYEEFSTPQVEFIMGYPLKQHDRHKVECIYFMKKGIVNKIYNRITYTLYHKLSICLKKSRLQLFTGEEWEFYFAPQWHALSFEFVEYMLSQLNNHPEILQRFAHSYAPDEILIPTILFNSPYKNKALCSSAPDGTSYDEVSTIHYLNYSPVIEVFDENSFDRLVHSGKCFARKLNSNKSESLIEMLDKHRKL